MRATKARLRRLEEAMAPKRRVLVVQGGSDAEFEAKIAALRASGEAGEHNLIVRIMKSWEPT